MLGHLRLSLEETVTRLSDVLGSPNELLEKSSLQRQHFGQVHAALYDKLEPKKLRYELRSCDSPRDICQQKASPFLSVPGMCQT